MSTSRRPDACETQAKAASEREELYGGGLGPMKAKGGKKTLPDLSCKLRCPPPQKKVDILGIPFDIIQGKKVTTNIMLYYANKAVRTKTAKVQSILSIYF